MDITLIQTADPIFYYPMLAETARTVRQYCIRNGLAYEQYVGLKRGRMAWHAAYNRVYMLKDMLDRGVGGWVLYLDADAMIIDQDFDLRRYLRDRDHHAGIFSGWCSDRPYDINSGGFAINLSHPWGRALVVDYHRAVADIPDAEFEGALRWELDVPEDQLILFRILSDYYEHRRCGDQFLFERTNGSYVNNGPFISQQLRSMHGDFPSRLAAIRRRVGEVLHGRRDGRNDNGAGTYIPAGHPRLATEVGVKHGSAISTDARAGYLLHGPYLDVDAGAHIVRIFGEARPASDGTPPTFRGDVADGDGGRLDEKTFDLPGHAKGVLAEYHIRLDRPVRHLEVRMLVDERQDIDIHAVHILRAND